MNFFKKFFAIILQHDFINFNQSNVIINIYLFVFIILFLENGLLPAAFLPGDSLLLLIGVLIGRKKLNFKVTIGILTLAASLGSWFSFQQGKWLEKTKLVQNWLNHIPEDYHKRAYKMFYRHGLSALLICRFFAFIRTLLPTIYGLSGLNIYRFQLFNFISALLWVIVLTMIGFILANTTFFKMYETKFMLILMTIQVILLILGIFSTIFLLCKKKEKDIT